MTGPGGKQAVVLSSGGADGAYAVGVMKALFSGQSPATGHLPLNPEVFTGSSIGAFNAAFIVSHPETDCATTAARLEQVWLEELAENPPENKNGAYRYRGDPSNLFDLQNMTSDPLHYWPHLFGDGAFLSYDLFKRVANFANTGMSIDRRLFKMVNFSSVVSAEPLMHVIKRSIHLENIRRSNTALRIAATNWDTGDLEIFSNGDLTEQLGPRIILASASLPGFLSPVEINRAPYVDAAVLGYAKLGPAIDAGADTLHLIYLDPDADDIPPEEIESTIDTLYRIFTITWAARLKRSLKGLARINRILKRLEEAARKAGLSTDQGQTILDALIAPTGKDRPVVKVTAHRYFPRRDFGSLGIFNLERKRIEELLEQGFKDAVEHDCADRGCVFADGSGA